MYIYDKHLRPWTSIDRVNCLSLVYCMLQNRSIMAQNHFVIILSYDVYTVRCTMAQESVFVERFYVNILRVLYEIF